MIVQHLSFVKLQENVGSGSWLSGEVCVYNMFGNDIHPNSWIIQNILWKHIGYVAWDESGFWVERYDFRV